MTVWKVPGKFSDPVYHKTKKCQAVQKAKRPATETTVEALKRHKPCKWCHDIEIEQEYRGAESSLAYKIRRGEITLDE